MSNSTLVAAMNPCPCGYYNHPTRECTCPPGAVHRYLGRISGPLMDRIDLHIELFCGLLVTVWLIINELISVLENLAAIGVPGFPRLNRLLSRLKSTVNEKEDEHDT